MSRRPDSTIHFFFRFRDREALLLGVGQITKDNVSVCGCAWVPRGVLTLASFCLHSQLKLITNCSDFNVYEIQMVVQIFLLKSVKAQRVFSVTSARVSNKGRVAPSLFWSSSREKLSGGHGTRRSRAKLKRRPPKRDTEMQIYKLLVI